jgi:hypothetical protein
MYTGSLFGTPFAKMMAHGELPQLGPRVGVGLALLVGGVISDFVHMRNEPSSLGSARSSEVIADAY